MYSLYSKEKNVSVIIPAYNEAKTIGNVVATALSHPNVFEVIVVDDGSFDGTAVVAASQGATIVRHHSNRGKAQAMETGVSRSSKNILFFIDADVIGLTHSAMSEAIEAVQSYSVDMYVLVVDRGRMVPDAIQKYLPLLGGIRVMRRYIWFLVPENFKRYFQIELALNYFTRQIYASTCWRVIPHFTHRIKETKRGIVWGLYQRFFMIRDIVVVISKLYIQYPFTQLWMKYIQ